MLDLLKYYTMKSLKNEKGQGMVEYALILGLISIVVIGVLVLFREPLIAVFTNILNALSGV